MSDALEPKDLARWQLAQKAVRDAEVELQKARDRLIATGAVYHHISGEISSAYAVQVGDTIDPQTGVITRHPD